MTTKAQLGFKVLLSIAVLYHLTVVLVLPNNLSLVARRWSRYLVTYANTFGLNTPWEFFSPAPAPTMYLQYTIDMGGTTEQEEQNSKIYYFPPSGPHGQWSPNENRLLYAMRFFILDPARLDRYFGPWVCRTHPGAVRVSIQHIIEPIPNIERAGIGHTFADMAQKMQVEARDYDCQNASHP